MHMEKFRGTEILSVGYHLYLIMKNCSLLLMFVLKSLWLRIYPSVQCLFQRTLQKIPRKYLGYIRNFIVTFRKLYIFN